MMIRSSKVLPLVILLSITVLGFMLRVYNYDFGLPEHWHPDEQFAAQAVAKFRSGTFVLQRYYHPPLIKILGYVIAESMNWLDGPAQPESQLYYEYRGLRLASVLSATITIVLVYILARYYLSVPFSLLAAFLYAVIPMCVFNGKYGTPDSLVSMFFVAVLIAQLHLIKNKSVIWYGVNGLMYGLGIAAKYSIVFLIIPFLVMHAYMVDRSEIKHFLKGFYDIKRIVSMVCGICIGLLAGFPQIFIGEFTNITKSLVHEVNHLFVKGHYGLTIEAFDYMLMFHFFKSILPNVGIVISVISIVGFVMLFLRRSLKKTMLILAILPYYFVIEYVYKVPVNYERYVLPLIGFYLICALIPLQKVFEKVYGKKMKIIVFTIFACILSVYPVYRTYMLIAHMKDDTRIAMKQWIDQSGKIPSGARIFIHWPGTGYYPLLDRRKFRYSQVRKNFSYKRVVKNADYVLASSLMYDRYFLYPDDIPKLTKYYTDLFEKAELLHEQTPDYQTYMIHNPVLRMYKVSTDER